VTDFSRDPIEVLDQNLGQRVVGLRVLQGVPILDRDLNLMQDLIAESVRSFLGAYLGSGVPVGSGAFQIAEKSGANNDFTIKMGWTSPGRCTVDGLEAQITADTSYTEQPGARAGVPAYPPPANGTHSDTVYLDVFLSTVESGTPAGNAVDIDNAADINVQTTVRLVPGWTVRVAPGAGVPFPPTGHHHYALATITRTANQPLIKAADIVDARRPLISLPAVRDAALAPTIFTVDPLAGGATQPVTITGTGFKYDFLTNADLKLTVQFGGVAAPQPTISAQSVQCTVPVGAPTGNQDVRISTVFGTTTAPKQFHISG
jgi:hypothetical protein